MSVRLVLFGVATLVLAVPAGAQQQSLPPQDGVVDAEGNVYDGPMPDSRPQWAGQQPQTYHHGMPPMQAGQPGAYPPGWDQARANWLAECRRRHGGGRTATGAVLGGVVGGVIGNRVAGRGDRVVGTVAGASVGAVAGGAIGAGADRRAAADWCEAYLEQNTTWGQGYPYGQQAVSYGYAPMTVMVPVAYVQVPTQTRPRECKETVVYYDTVRTTTPARYRTVTTYRRAPDKRVRIVPDKRVRIAPDKRVPIN